MSNALQQKRKNEAQAFMEQLDKLPQKSEYKPLPRILFIMDATASRRPTWDVAAKIQGEMFIEAQKYDGLEIQLAFFRGFQEFKVSKWQRSGVQLAKLMSCVQCLAGETQIARSLKHAANVAQKEKLRAVVLVGDCCEEELDRVGHQAGRLGSLEVPVFCFHEGGNKEGAVAFKEIAKLSNGCCFKFSRESPESLKRLLVGAAAYASGGEEALPRSGIKGLLPPKL